jgi:hypothetical protein
MKIDPSEMSAIVVSPPVEPVERYGGTVQFSTER